VREGWKVGLERKLGEGENVKLLLKYMEKRIQKKEYQIYITFLTAINTNYS
jgi:hypothetical protein